MSEDSPSTHHLVMTADGTSKVVRHDVDGLDRPLSDGELEQLRTLDGPPPLESRDYYMVSCSVQELAIRAVREIQRTRAELTRLQRVILEASGLFTPAQIEKILTIHGRGSVGTISRGATPPAAFAATITED